MVETVRVTGKPKAVDVKSSDVSHVTTDKEILSLPVESVTEAVALNTGVVVQGGELHVRGGRSNEVSVRIDGVPVDDPLSGGSVDLGLLSVAQSELITGGMDAEYGNASSAIINYTTKSGGRNFEGNFRYTTDDYGRADKTFTNYDRVSLGLGGPTPVHDLTYYVSGEATFLDGEVLTVRNYPEHEYLDGLDQGEGTCRRRVPRPGAARLEGERGHQDVGRDDARPRSPPIRTCTTGTPSAYVSTLISSRRCAEPLHARFYTIVRHKSLMYDGPWYAEGAERPPTSTSGRTGDCHYCLLPISDNRTRARRARRRLPGSRRPTRRAGLRVHRLRHLRGLPEPALDLGAGPRGRAPATPTSRTSTPPSTSGEHATPASSSSGR